MQSAQRERSVTRAFAMHAAVAAHQPLHVCQFVSRDAFRDTAHHAFVDGAAGNARRSRSAVIFFPADNIRRRPALCAAR